MRKYRWGVFIRMVSTIISYHLNGHIHRLESYNLQQVFTIESQSELFKLFLQLGNNASYSLFCDIMSCCRKQCAADFF